MSGYQRFVCLGNIVKDAESRMAGESEIAKFSVAVNGRQKNRETGQWEDQPEFFDCEYWKPGGVLEYLTQGTQVVLEGEIQTQKWQKDGEWKSRKIVRVNKVQLCGGKKREEPAMEAEFAGDFK